MELLTLSNRLLLCIAVKSRCNNCDQMDMLSYLSAQNNITDTAVKGCSRMRSAYAPVRAFRTGAFCCSKLFGNSAQYAKIKMRQSA